MIVRNVAKLVIMMYGDYTDFVVCGIKQVGVAKRSRDQSLSHEFSLVLDADFERFVTSVEKRIAVSRKIARALGDPRPTNVCVTRLEPGSVKLSWTNSSLMPSNRITSCPVQVSNSTGSRITARDALQAVI